MQNGKSGDGRSLKPTYDPAVFDFLYSEYMTDGLTGTVVSRILGPLTEHERRLTVAVAEIGVRGAARCLGISKSTAWRQWVSLRGRIIKNLE